MSEKKISGREFENETLLSFILILAINCSKTKDCLVGMDARTDRTPQTQNTFVTFFFSRWAFPPLFPPSHITLSSLSTYEHMFHDNGRSCPSNTAKIPSSFARYTCAVYWDATNILNKDGAVTLLKTTVENIWEDKKKHTSTSVMGRPAVWQ